MTLSFTDFLYVENNLKTIIFAETGQQPDDKDLKTRFIQILNSRQHVQLSNTTWQSVISFGDNELGVSDQVESMISFESKRLENTLSQSDKDGICRNIRHAEILMNRLMPNFFKIYRLLVSEIACIRAYGSGGRTASNVLGVIWLSPLNKWTTIDYGEALVHETVHLAIFLDDMLHGIYTDARSVHDEAAKAQSAIRGEQRPVDKSLHSSCVAAVISDYYQALGDHETSISFIPKLDAAVADIRNSSAYGYLGGKGKSLIHELQQYVTQRQAT